MRRVACFSALVALLLIPEISSAQPLVVIDPGHGGSDPGAVGCGLREAPMALDVSLRLRRLLEDAGMRVRMTRSDDTYVSLSGRTTLANSAGADRFVSIHNNAHTSSASGTETFMYTSGSSASRDLRDRIQREMIRAWMLPDRGGKTAGFYVLKYTSMPATLSELAFITRCSPDAELIGDPDARQAAAEAHFVAIAGHLGLDTTLPSMDGTISGAVYEDVGLGEEDTSRRLAGARVTLVEAETSVDAAADTAEFAFTVPPGTYTLRAELDGYEAGERACVLDGTSAVCPIGLTPAAADVDAGVEAVDAGFGGDAPDAGLADAASTTDRALARKAVGGCSASGAAAAGLGWMWMLALLAVVMARRRWTGAVLIAAWICGVAGCGGDADPGSTASALEGALQRDEGATAVPRPSDAVEAATVEPFAVLTDDSTVLAEELGAALLSPDAERVALTLPGHRGLRVLELATLREVTLTEEPRAGWLPIWRADGLAIGYRAPEQSGSAVPMHAATVDGRSIAPFTSIDGPHLVERDGRIVRVDRDGAVRTVSPQVAGERFVAPVRSPDGKHVVFLGLSTGLYVHRIEDGRTAALGPGTQPSYSADGQWLVFARTEDDGHRLTASDLFLTGLGYDAYPTGRLTDTPDRIELSPSLDATATRIAYLDEGTDELHVAALELTDPAVLEDAEGGTRRAAHHLHRTGAPAHTHPHLAPDDDPWHLVLGHE